MTLRESLLAHLREPNYSPANEFELSRRLGLTKKHRAMLAHEVRLVLKGGEFVRAQNGRIGPRRTEHERPRAKESVRPIFTPTKRTAAATSAAPKPVDLPSKGKSSRPQVAM